MKSNKNYLKETKTSLKILNYSLKKYLNDLVAMLILIEDLNSTSNPKIDHLPLKKLHLSESQLIKFLKPNFYNTYRLFHSDTNKYSCYYKNCYSRIDQI